MEGEVVIQDQASRLRQWVRQYASAEAGVGGRMPRLVVFLGGRTGVGVTTLAMNLAAAFGACRMRTVLLDCDLGRADATRRCGLRTRETLADVVSAGRTLADVLQPTPAGFYLAPGIGPGEKLLGDPRYSWQRILEGFRSLAGWADMVLVDLGTQLTPWTRTLWRAGDCRLIVTTPDQHVLMDTYAAIKLLTTQVGLAPIQVVVNQASGPPEAQEVYERLARTCLRFLALPVSLAGFVPVDFSLVDKERKSDLPTLWRLAGESAERIKQITSYVGQVVGKRNNLSAGPTGAEASADPSQADLASPASERSVQAESDGPVCPAEPAGRGTSPPAVPGLAQPPVQRPSEPDMSEGKEPGSLFRPELARPQQPEPGAFGRKEPRRSLHLEPAWSRASAAPGQWHVQPGDWVGKVGFPVTVSPSLDEPVGENRKKV